MCGYRLMDRPQYPSPALEERLKFEALVADLSATFVSLPAEAVDREIETAQRLLVEALDLDRSSLYELSPDGVTLTMTHYWSRAEFPPLTRGIPESQFPWIRSRIRQGEIVVLPSLDQLPQDTADKANMEALGIKSNVSLPLTVDGQVVGGLTFGVLREERPWPVAIVNRLRLVAQVFAGALARKRSDVALRAALAEVEQLRDRLRDENEYLQREVRTLHGGAKDIIGRSSALLDVLEQAQQVAGTTSTVLLLGETGTGKELMATHVHELSPRRGRMMVRVNCAAIPAALLESELFGREKGAYTGALSRQIGRFEIAHQSTLFLDEVGDLPLDVQAKLLRVLQEKEFERLGSPKPIRVDVRLIAATNRDLEAAVADGSFRKDLYYRLNVFPIRLPPLRERADDIPELVWAFVDELSRSHGKQVDEIPKANMLQLQRYGWPGNIREVRNVVERAVILARGRRLAIALPAGSERAAAVPGTGALADVERNHIRAVLEKTGWRVRGEEGAASILGIKPTTLEARMARLGLHRPKRASSNPS